jgi:phosphonopyruvate decarboxylase
VIDPQTVCAVIDEERGSAVAVATMSGLGFLNRTRPELDFAVVGLMGGAASIGLGIAVGRPDRDVWVIDGDGSLVMQLGVLAAVADAAPANLVHILIDNGIYAISGAQPVPGQIDWQGLALAAGYRSSVVCETADELRAALRGGDRPVLVVAHCERERPSYPPGVFEIDPSSQARQLREALAAG